MGGGRVEVRVEWCLVSGFGSTDEERQVPTRLSSYKLCLNRSSVAHLSLPRGRRIATALQHAASEVVRQIYNVIC